MNKTGEKKVIDSALLFIKKHTGLSLDLCSHFSGLREYKSRMFFNVEIEKPCFDCVELAKITTISGFDKTILSVEPNGFKRIAIFINLNKLKVG